MSDEQQKQHSVLVVAAISAVISGGGAHIATKESEDLPVNSTTLEDCRAFSEHSREHERATCEIEKTKLMIRCKQ